MDDLFIPIVELIRLEESFQYGTFGVLKINKEVFCVTLEPPDIFNKPNLSCIPAQQYICQKIVSPKYGDCYEIKDVPDRTNVLFHAGNTAQDTKGCIIVAQHFGKLGQNRAALNSGATYKRFKNKLWRHDVFHLTIKECY